MLLDSVLLLGSLLGAYGVLKFLAQLSDRIIPVMGVLSMLVGAGMMYWVYVESGRELMLSDIPDALFRLIGHLN